jgi:hypothetical protein
MPIEDDPAYERYSKAIDQLRLAYDEFRAHAEGHPNKKAAWGTVKLAMDAVAAAANEIEPKYKP